MKRKMFMTVFLLFASVVYCLSQNVGIKTTTPQAALDINGDMALRKATITLPAGANNNVDISSNKFSVYDFAGGALTGGAQIYGFTGGTDGRIVTIFNNSITSAIQLADENNPGSASSAPVNRISTGSGNSAIIYQNGSATLRYDGQKQRWTIINSNYTDGLSASSTSSAWSISGANILNSNTGNVGIGETLPVEKLHINNGNIKIGKALWTSAADDRVIKFGDGDFVTIGEKGGDDELEIKAFNVNFNASNVKLPTGSLGINTTTPIVNKLQIGNTVSPFAGNDICIGNGTQTMSITQTPQAATWFSNNSFSFLPVGSGLGNVGIGDAATDFKLAISSNTVQSNTNTHVLSLKGRNPVLSFFNEDNSTYGYLKVWNYAPFAPYTNGLVIGANPGYPIFFSTNNYGVTMTVADNGNVGIGTTTPTYKLSVNGNIRAKEVVVETGWADYVFENNYQLRPLAELESFIKQHQHLPNIPSAKEIEANGLKVGEVQKKMMEKIEELTLYLIELKKEIEVLKKTK